MALNSALKLDLDIAAGAPLTDALQVTSARPGPQADTNHLGLADAAINPATPSPAAALQSRLQSEFDAPAVEGQWSARRTTAFVCTVCSMFWAGLIWAGVLVF